MEQSKILVVDDEKEIRDLIEIYLKNEGYTVYKTENGIEALDILNSACIDLIILDIMMPKMDGMEACIKIRQEKDMPIIMLSAKSEDIDKIMGLTTGADDYMTKPFNPLELVARVKSQLRRYKRFNSSYNENIEKNSGIIQIDDLVINVDTHEVKVDNKGIKLTPTEFNILELLARNKGIVLSIEKIYEVVWNEAFMESSSTVMVHVRKIREKIEDNPRKPKYIKTVWGVGYRIEN